MHIKTAQRLIELELIRAVDHFDAIKSLHEGIAVIEEEYLELRTEVYKKNPNYDKLMNEAIQVAAMGLRFLIDLIPDTWQDRQKLQNAKGK